MAYSDSIKLTMSSSEEIGKAIQKQRRAQKITQKEFAQRLGKSERTICLNATASQSLKSLECNSL